MGMLATGFDLTGKIAAVTGAASGIGRTTAELLSEAGASVVLADVNEPGLRFVAGELLALDRRVAISVGDCSQRESAVQLVKTAVAEFGRLDVLCNVAGVPCDIPLSEVEPSEVERIFGINFNSALYGCQAAFAAMKETGGGSIINVSSTAIDVPHHGNGLYATTKAAVAMMTMALAAEFGRSACGSTLSRPAQR